jgi:Na+-transporting methylmalonyl-CoA/oxaloacetate decarboxylase gamma subunit
MDAFTMGMIFILAILLLVAMCLFVRMIGIRKEPKKPKERDKQIKENADKKFHGET